MIDELPEGWALTTLGEVTESKVSQGEPKGTEFTYIDIASIDNTRKIITEPKKLPLKDAPSRARQHVRPGDVLVSMTRPNLNAVGVVPESLSNSIASTGFHVLRPREVLPDWLYALVRSTNFVSAMSELVQGALYPAVRPSDIRDFQIPLPPLAEQRRIVAKIEEMTARSRAARAVLAEMPTLLEQFRQSVLASAFRGDLTAEWRAKHPHTESASELLAHIRTERRKQWETKYPKKKYVEPDPVDDTDLPELPEGWCWAGFNECTWEITVGHVGSMKERYVADGVRFLRSQNVRPMRFDPANLVHIPADFDTDLKKSRLYGGEILIVRSGANVGDCCVYPHDAGLANCSDLVISRPLSGLVPEFGALFINTPEAQVALGLRTVGNAQAHFNIGAMKTTAFPLAPFDEQREIIQRISASERSRRLLQSEVGIALEEVTQLDQSLLAKAYRGELVPQDTSDEPASVLLERLRAEQAAAPEVRTRRRKSRE